MATANGFGFASASAQLFLCHSSGMSSFEWSSFPNALMILFSLSYLRRHYSGESRKILLLNGSAYIPPDPTAAHSQATTPTTGRPRNTSVTNDAMPSSYARGDPSSVTCVRRARVAPTKDAEDTEPDDLEVFIAEMTRRFDAEADALDSLAQSSSSPTIDRANDKHSESNDFTSGPESDTDDVNNDVSTHERSGKVKVKIYAPFLSQSQNDTPADDSASTPKNIRVTLRTDVVKESCNPRQWMAVSSADRVPKITDLTVGCDGPRLPPRYPDWAAEIAEEREKLAAEVFVERLDKLAPRPPMNFDTEVRISRRLRDGSVLLPKSKRRKVVHVSTHEA